MADLRLTSLRGGLNNSDPPSDLAPDQATVANNVEWIRSTLGERRQGCSAVSSIGNLSGHDKVTFLFRHTPTADEGDAELWALGVTGTASSTLVRKTSSWSDVTLTGTPTLSGVYPFRWQAVSLHGKIFVALKHGAGRLHVGDGAAATSLRYAGIAAPSAPTSADTGSGTFTGTRYYRVRMTVQSGGVTIRRSEPSAVLTDAPSGSGSAIRVTKPTTIENATHWELEASTDNINFYVLATTAVGTTTVDDSTDYAVGYRASGYELSEDVGDYTVLPSAVFLAVDEDRLLFAGDYETTANASRVGWTPVYAADGAGNDERQEIDTFPYLDLDNFDGGAITGLSNPVMGVIYAFKSSQIFGLTRRNQRSQAYKAFRMTEAMGALHGSVANGLDQRGQPCVYFLDSVAGPCRIGIGGIMPCGDDIRDTWESLNVDATQVVCRSLYYPKKRQMHWWIATGSANVPDVHLVLHTRRTRDTIDGVRGGWSLWTGPSAAVLSACLFSSNIGSNTTRNRVLKPFYGMTGNGLLWMADTGDDDNGTEYTSRLVSRPLPLGTIHSDSEIKSATLQAKAVSSASIDVKLIRDYGLQTETVSAVSFTASASETHLFKKMDDLGIGEARTLQVEFVDVSTPGTRWELNEFEARVERGNKP